MTQADLLRHVVAILEEAGIEYMITGSIASSLQGEPRATHDLDVVVQIRDAEVPAILAAFPQPRFYVDKGAIREAIRTAGMFNVIDVTEGDKVDFWMLTDEPFDRSRFSRRIRERALGIEFSPEDDGTVRLLEPIEPGKARRALVTILDEGTDESLHETALLSERALGDWEREEEEEAWRHLQSEQ